MHCSQLKKEKQKKKECKKFEELKNMDAQSSSLFFFKERKEEKRVIDNKQKNANGYYENILISIEINHAANLAKNSTFSN